MKSVATDRVAFELSAAGNDRTSARSYAESGTLACMRIKPFQQHGQPRVIVSSDDHARLRKMLSDPAAVDAEGWGAIHGPDIAGLRFKLDQALVVDPDRVPADIVTMNSTIHVQPADCSSDCEWTIVYPPHADVTNGGLPILAPAAVALFGRRIGEAVDCAAPAGRRRLRLVRMIYQPEAAADFAQQGNLPLVDKTDSG